MSAWVPGPAPKHIVLLLGDYPPAPQVHPHRKQTPLLSQMRTPRMVFPYGPLWRLFSELFSCLSHSESLPGPALRWDVRAAAALMGLEAEVTANDRSRMFPKSKLLKSIWDTSNKEPKCEGAAPFPLCLWHSESVCAILSLRASDHSNAGGVK